MESKRLAEQEVGETWGCPEKVKAGFLGRADSGEDIAKQDRENEDYTLGGKL